jgi:biotin transport system ATP-binding protein
MKYSKLPLSVRTVAETRNPRTRRSLWIHAFSGMTEKLEHRDLQIIDFKILQQMNIIEIENLTHRFSNNFIGLDRVNLKIREGEFVVIAGANGSGKTTLLRHLNGLLLPDAGTVRISGFSVSERPKQARQYVGMVFQDADTQIVGETVYDDVAFGPENLCLPEQEIQIRVKEALKAVELWEFRHHRPHLLSGGEKRRLAIAGVLTMNPKVLVFDEPFSNLDYPGIRQVLSQMLNLHKQGHTIVVTTHDLEKVIAHAQRLIIMRKGKLVRDGIPENLVTEVENFGIRMPCSFQFKGKFISWLK